MKSAYLLATSLMNDESFSGSWIWKLPTLPRIQFFIWKCMHHSISVKDCLANRGIPLDTTCPVCHLESESITHALRDCRMIKSIWLKLGTHCLQTNFFSQGIREWLITNANLKSSQNTTGIPWNILFSFALWLIWKQRNQIVFASKRLNPHLFKIISTQASEFFLCAAQPARNKCVVVRQIRWEKPELGWLKLNTDASSNASLGSAAGGGLIRDERGNWVIGFTRKLGTVNSFTAEIWALRDGLLLCCQMKLPAVIVELDAKALVDAFVSPSYSNLVISPLFDDCKLLASQIPNLRFRHVYREANICADRLANLGLSQHLDFFVHSNPPVGLISFVTNDCLGVACNRLCPIGLAPC